MTDTPPVSSKAQTDLDAYIAEIEGRFQCIDGEPSAVAPSGDIYQSIGHCSGHRALSGIVPQGFQRILATTEDEAVAQFRSAFEHYAAGRIGTLYWRMRPAIEWDNQHEQCTVYCRLVISDTTARDEDAPVDGGQTSGAETTGNVVPFPTANEGNGAPAAITTYIDGNTYAGYVATNPDPLLSQADHMLTWLWTAGFKVVPVAGDE